MFSAVDPPLIDRTSSAMDHLVEEFKKHHTEIASRVIGTLFVHEKHVTQHQLLAEA